MLSIVSFGLTPASAAFGPAVRAHEAAGALDDLAAAVAPGDDETVLALVSDRAPSTFLARLQTARSALATTRVVIHETSLPPLAGGAVAALITELAARSMVDESVLLSRLDLVEGQVAAAAWLGSVARLQHPAPALGLHARSYLPGTAFSALVADEARVVPLPRRPTSMRLPPPRLPGDWRVRMAVGEDADVALVERSLAEQLPRADVERCELTAASRAWWGTDRLVELAFVPARIEGVADLLRAHPAAPCAWCGRLLASSVCPHCRFVAPGPGATAEEATPGSAEIGGSA